MVGVNKSIILTTFVAIALFALAIIPSQLWLTQDNISAWIDTWLPEGLLLQVISLYSVFTFALTFGVPRQFVAIACGYILGQWVGMLVGLFAAVSACLKVFMDLTLFFYVLVQLTVTSKVTSKVSPPLTVPMSTEIPAAFEASPASSPEASVSGLPSSARLPAT